MLVAGIPSPGVGHRGKTLYFSFFFFVLSFLSPLGSAQVIRQWKWFKALNISVPSNFACTSNCAIGFTVNTASLVAQGNNSAPFNYSFFCISVCCRRHLFSFRLLFLRPGQLRPDGNDLRFCLDDTNCEAGFLNHYHVDAMNTADTPLLVQIPTLSPTTLTIYMYELAPNYFSESEPSVFSAGFTAVLKPLT